MKIYDKFINKYGTKEVLLPPPPEEIEEMVEEPNLTAPTVPYIPELSEEEMGKFFNWRYDPEEAHRIRKYLQNMEELNKQHSDLGVEDKGEDRPTRVATPQSKSDMVFKACTAFFHLATKK